MNSSGKLPPKPSVIAHRGASHDFPENTHPAFEEIVQSRTGPPIHGIEMDVQLTRDKIPVLFHDRTLKRVIGTDSRIGEYTLSELDSMNFGGQVGQKSFQPAKIVTLEEFLSRYGRKIENLFIETKARNIDDPVLSKLLTNKVVDMVLSNGIEKNVVLLFFNTDMLMFSHVLSEKVRLVQLLDEPTPTALSFWKGNDWLHGFGFNLESLSEEVVCLARSFGKVVYTFTCNTPAEVDIALSAKVDGIITNKPIWLSHYLESLYSPPSSR